MKTNLFAAASCSLATQRTVVLVLACLAGAAHALAAVRYVNLANPSPAPPYTNWAGAATNIQDAIDVAVAGDGIVVTNGIYQTGGRAVNGMMTNRVTVDKPVTVRSVNGPEVTVIRGYQVPGTTNGDSAVRCVYLTNGAWLVGFTLTNGATRRSYDFEGEWSGGGVWCASAGAAVSYCVFRGNSAGGYPGGGGAYGGTLNNCTFSDNSAIEDEFNLGWGGGASSSTLNNCTLTRNSAYNGGGAFQCILNNCTLTSNSATLFGGGVAAQRLLGVGEECILNNCTLTGNSALYGGAAALHCRLNNCTLSDNSAATGGAVSFGRFGSPTLNNCTLAGNKGGGVGSGGPGSATLNNCIVYYNSGDNYEQGNVVLNYCCTTPLPTNGVGNFENPPLFVDAASGNLRLQANSPCINSGLNADAPALPDLDGHPRIVGGTVDVGAYEFQSPGSLISYAWLQQFGLTTDSSADFTDADGDGLTNWQEWRCGTNPTNALSALRLLTPQRAGADLLIGWESVPGRSYVLESSPTLSVPAPFAPAASHIQADPVAGTTTFTHINAAGSGPWFYRVRVKE